MAFELGSRGKKFESQVWQAVHHLGLPRVGVQALGGHSSREGRPGQHPPAPPVLPL